MRCLRHRGVAIRGQCAKNLTEKNKRSILGLNVGVFASGMLPQRPAAAARCVGFLMTGVVVFGAKP
jgi:hypothetical protein